MGSTARKEPAYFMGSDATVTRKNMSMSPFFECPGCLGNDVRFETGAWVLVAVLPRYSIKAAKLAGRVEGGVPLGYCRRKALIPPLAQLSYHFLTWGA